MEEKINTCQKESCINTSKYKILGENICDYHYHKIIDSINSIKPVELSTND